MHWDPFLKLTGLNVDDRNNLKHHNLLAYDGETFGEPQALTEYSLEQAISTVLALELAKVGIDQETAADLVARNDSEILQAVKQATKNEAEDGPDIWLAVVRFYYQDVGVKVDGRRIVAAPLAEIYKAETKYGLISQIERHSAAIAMTNISHALRGIERRACQNRIELKSTSILF